MRRPFAADFLVHEAPISSRCMASAIRLVQAVDVGQAHGGRVSNSTLPEDGGQPSRDAVSAGVVLPEPLSPTTPQDLAPAAVRRRTLRQPTA